MWCRFLIQDFVGQRRVTGPGLWMASAFGDPDLELPVRVPKQLWDIDGMPPARALFRSIRRHQG